MVCDMGELLTVLFVMIGVPALVALGVVGYSVVESSVISYLEARRR